MRAGVAHWGSSVAPAGTAPIPGMLIVDWGFAVVRRARGRRERMVRRVGGCMVGEFVGFVWLLVGGCLSYAPKFAERSEDEEDEEMRYLQLF